MIAASSGGSSLSAEDLFHNRLALQGVQFEVQAKEEGSTQKLTIRASDVNKTYQTIHQDLKGRLVGAEVADLNSNGRPEVYVFVRNGDGHGEVIVYSVMNSNSLSPIYLQELSGQLLNGYRGGMTSFRWSKNAWRVASRFTNRVMAMPSPPGGLRQICYRLQNGESSFVLKSTSALQF